MTVIFLSEWNEDECLNNASFISDDLVFDISTLP